MKNQIQSYLTIKTGIIIKDSLCQPNPIIPHNQNRYYYKRFIMSLELKECHGIVFEWNETLGGPSAHVKVFITQFVGQRRACDNLWLNLWSKFVC